MRLLEIEAKSAVCQMELGLQQHSDVKKEVRALLFVVWLMTCIGRMSYYQNHLIILVIIYTCKHPDLYNLEDPTTPSPPPQIEYFLPVKFHQNSAIAENSKMSANQSAERLSLLTDRPENTHLVGDIECLLLVDRLAGKTRNWWSKLTSCLLSSFVKICSSVSKKSKVKKKKDGQRPIRKVELSLPLGCTKKYV